mgnify:CR=1 FL=1
MIEKACIYFEAFSNKDLEKLADIYTDDVVLTDWDIHFEGKNDVLERFQQTSEKYNAKTIVRLCGDSPILHWAIIDKVIESYLEGDYDYASNLLPPPRTYPDGLLVEVFSAKILKEAFLNAKKPSEREHVTPYIWMNPQKFKLHKVNYSEDLSSFRFNLDYQDDYEFLKQILEKLSTKNRLFTLEEVIQWLRKNPDILKINSQIMPNLGWVKSLEEDKLQGFS